MEDNILDDLNKELVDVNLILDSIENNEGFTKFIEKFKRDAERVDNEWYKIPNIDQEVFNNLKSFKLAYVILLESVENFKFEKERLEQEIEDYKNSKEIE